MTEQSDRDFIRTCQECGHQQVMKDPATYKDKTNENWRDLMCRRCKSTGSLDYGSYRNDNTTEAEDYDHEL